MIVILVLSLILAVDAFSGHLARSDAFTRTAALGAGPRGRSRGFSLLLESSVRDDLADSIRNSDLIDVGPVGDAQQGDRNSIMIIAGFEQFNVDLYKRAAAEVTKNKPGTPVVVFTDKDIEMRPTEVQAALQTTQVLFCSLVFDYAQVAFLLDESSSGGNIKQVPSRFCFESALELMSQTQVGAFEMSSGGGQAPAPVRALLKQFGSKKEEDKMSGYLNFLKIGPKLLKWVPVTQGKLKDLRTWLTVYSYWSEGGLENVRNMLYSIVEDPQLMGRSTSNGPSASASKAGTGEIGHSLVGQVSPSPNVGLFHPALLQRAASDPKGLTQKYMEDPREYVRWYEETHPWVTESTPRVGVLLYRKHVLTDQAYIPNVITLMETEGLMPIPIFINGVEGHTVVRDLFTSEYEKGNGGERAVKVDAIVNTIGFPLVGGPAGSMEGGRGIELAKEILSGKDVPYYVAAPLVIQDVQSWQDGGVQGLQQVVLYSLPELDGAVEAVVLGGLIGDSIVAIPERVRKLTGRIKARVGLRKKPVKDRSVAVITYGFPPNVGAVGTAALLNVEKSLENFLLGLHDEGYDVGPIAPRTHDARLCGGRVDGKAIVKALKILSRENVYALGAEGAQRVIEQQGISGITVTGPQFATYSSRSPSAVYDTDTDTDTDTETDASTGKGSSTRSSSERSNSNIGFVSPSQLRQWLGKLQTAKMESQWGELGGSSSKAKGDPGPGQIGSGSGTKYSVLGLQIGKVWVAVQPLLGLEGDPMRLLFERDLTPHPQYAAFYAYLNNVHKPDSVVHFGMHGTVEWLPGSPLGNTAQSWSDVLTPQAPNSYVYACNNPSESLLAKRRGYATIVSHNVPPYARAGLYKDLASLKELLVAFRDDKTTESKAQEQDPEVLAGSISVIYATARRCGLHKDVAPPKMNKIHNTGSNSLNQKKQVQVQGQVQGQGQGEIEEEEDPEAAVYIQRELSESIHLSASTYLAAFESYRTSLASYLGVLENRLFSSGLHVIGQPPSEESVLSYLQALYGETDDAPPTPAHSPTTATPTLASASASTPTQALEGPSADSASAGAFIGVAADKETHRAATLDKQVRAREKLSTHTLQLISSGALAEAHRRAEGGRGADVEPSSALLLQAMRSHKQSSHLNSHSHSPSQSISPVLDWDAPPSESGWGVNWKDALTEEDRFALALLRRGDIGDLLTFEGLRWQGAFAGAAYREVEAKVQDMIVSSKLASGQKGAAADSGDVTQAVQLAQKLAGNPDIEMKGLMRSVGGAYVPAAPGGDLLRDGPAVLPTGSNIHALDPYRIPSDTALLRGRIAAEKIIGAHRKANGGAYPETVAVTLWGLDVIKTKGESVAIVLGLVGAVPRRESTGRIVAFDLVPMNELQRPRIDVVCSLSGIFRDTFSHVLNLLDEMFEAAAAEDPALLAQVLADAAGGGAVPDTSVVGNFIRKHSDQIINQAGGLGAGNGNTETGSRPTQEDKPRTLGRDVRSDLQRAASARLFSQPPGEFGSMVNENVGTGDWSEGKQLGSQWESRNSFAYGRPTSTGSTASGGQTAQARPETLKTLLRTTERVVQQVDSVEYGLTDIQEYYANTGGLVRAAKNYIEDGSSKTNSGTIGVSIIEAFEEQVAPKDLEDTLRLEYRSKLLNPAWAEAMVSQGSGGAYEVSTRMTALLGWGGTVGFADKFVYDGAAERYALDPNMAQRLKDSNPEAFQNIVKRMLEASGRGLWTPDEGVLEKLQELYSEAEDAVEGVN